jgi:hypothetical protein
MMRTSLKLRILLVLVMGFAWTMASGCAAPAKESRSGFLTDYSRLKQDDPLSTVDWLYVNESVVFGAYDEIMLEHVVFFLKGDAQYRGIQADEVTDLSDAFHDAIVEALSGPYSFTDEPGPGVMRMRMAITDLVPSKPASGTITTVVPVGLAASHIKKAATGSHIGIGEVAIEAELLDSQTDEVLGAVIDRQTGKKFKVDKTFTKWGHAKEAFKLWAQTLRKRLNMLSGRE